MVRRAVFYSGYGESVPMMAPFTTALSEEIESFVVCPNYFGDRRFWQSPTFDPVQNLANDAAKDIPGDTTEIDIIAHSLGALVAAKVVESKLWKVRSATLIAPAGVRPDTYGVVPRFLENMGKLTFSSQAMAIFALHQAGNILKRPDLSILEAYVLSHQNGQAITAFDPSSTLVVAYPEDDVYEDAALTVQTMMHGFPIVTPIGKSASQGDHSQLIRSPEATARLVAQHINRLP